MVTKVFGKLTILNCYPRIGDIDIVLADYKKKRRDLFKKWVFEVRKNPTGRFELYVNDRLVTCWFPGERQKARNGIDTAYNTYRAMEEL